MIVTTEIRVGHVLDELAAMDAESVSCCVTSPPYWSLRKYDAPEVVWGGDPDCPHTLRGEHEDVAGGASASGGYAGKRKWQNAGVSREETPEAWVKEASGDHGTRHGKSGTSLDGGRNVYDDVPDHERTDSATCARCGAWRGQYGLEPTPDLYVEHTLDVLRAIRRVLRPDGVVWWNIGDGYASNPAKGNHGAGKEAAWLGDWQGRPPPSGTLKPKDLVLMPSRVALAAQADGWWVRKWIVWCLSGGACVYAKTQKGEMPMTVRDVARLDPATVSLWNGECWTRLRGMSKSKAKGDEIELVLRSGERIGCTPTHRFPTESGLTGAGEIAVGDKLVRTRLPEPENPKDSAIDVDAAWFAGLYIAEGSRSGDTIQIAGHAKEAERWERVQRIAAKYGGSATRTVDGNCMDIRVYGKVLVALIDELTTGTTAKTKGFAPVVWRYSNRFIESLVDGYLGGDGHHDEANGRWRLGFTRNYNLERDLRTACARLGWTLTLATSSVKYDGRNVATFRGEIRKTRSGHHNERSREEVVAVRRARCREVYDLGVEHEPHLFALASGILTHNSKPNAMPESCQDRPTSSHETILMMAKNATYWYDADAVRESYNGYEFGHGPAATATDNPSVGDGGGHSTSPNPSGRNMRDVWTFSTAQTPEAHFATFPEELPRRCILASCPREVCQRCGHARERIVERTSADDHIRRLDQDRKIKGKGFETAEGLGGQRHQDWLDAHPAETSCDCPEPDYAPGLVLDPFAGIGTTGVVAKRLGRRFVGIELSDKYAAMARDKLALWWRPSKLTEPDAPKEQMQLDLDR